MLPKVVVYDAVSLEGCTVGLDVDEELYYKLASKWDLDAILMGSNTLLALFNAQPGDEKSGEFKLPKVDPETKKQILVVPDTGGIIRIWDEVQKLPYIRDALVLCSRSTPLEYLDFLEEKNIKHMVIGYDEVDLGSALEELNSLFDVESLRVDSGGILNGALFREGLVDEVNVMIHPQLVGSTSPSSIFPASDLNAPIDRIQLVLVKAEVLKNGIVWLQYRVFK